MARIVVSPQAESDLARIADEIGDKAGLSLAERYVDRVMALVASLSVVPKASGRPVPQLGPGLRCHPMGAYNLYLRHDEETDTLFVVRVLHGRRDITAELFKA